MYARSLFGYLREEGHEIRENSIYALRHRRIQTELVVLVFLS